MVNSVRFGDSAMRAGRIRLRPAQIGKVSVVTVCCALRSAK